MDVSDPRNRPEGSGVRRAALMLILIGATGAASAVDARTTTNRLAAPRSLATGILFKFEDFFGSNTRGSGQKNFRDIDRNGDGILSAEELEHAFGSRYRSILSGMDRNRDGHVTVDEVRDSGGARGAQGAGGTRQHEQRSATEPGGSERAGDSKGNGSRDADDDRGGGRSSNSSSGNGNSEDRGASGNGRNDDRGGNGNGRSDDRGANDKGRSDDRGSNGNGRSDDRGGNGNGRGQK